MITLIAFDARRALRRRLSILLVAVPALLVIATAISHWAHRSFPGAAALVILLLSSLVIFTQDFLSDRAGKLELAISTSPIPRWLPPVRLAVLLVVPFSLQFAFMSVLLKLFGL
jgi:hypothetical protein